MKYEIIVHLGRASPKAMLASLELWRSGPAARGGLDRTPRDFYTFSDNPAPNLPSANRKSVKLRFMDQKWEIIYYETSQGNFPVFEFIQSLDPKIKSKVIGVMELLKELGTLVGPPHSKKLTGTPPWELRILGSDNIRIFYVAVVSRKFLLLHAFLKKKQKTDKREIKTAINRLNDFKLR